MERSEMVLALKAALATSGLSKRETAMLRRALKSLLDAVEAEPEVFARCFALTRAEAKLTGQDVMTQAEFLRFARDLLEASQRHERA